MEDVPKLRYLTGIGPNAKFKRAVPKHLVPLAEKTAWVERVPNLSAAELKRRAPLFAAKTNQEIEILERRFAEGNIEPSKAINPSDSDLSDDQARELSIWYFSTKQNEVLNSSAYGPREDDAYLDDAAHAADKVRMAELNQLGEQRYTPGIGLRILESVGIVQTLPPKNSTEYWQLWREWDAKPGFQKLCSYLDRTELELANRHLSSYAKGNLVPITDEMFAQHSARQRPAIMSANTTVKQLVDQFVELQGRGVTRSRRDQYVVPGRALVECLGESRCICELSPPDFKLVLTLLPTIPAYVARHFAGISLKQASEKFEKQHNEPANRHKEARKHLQIIKQMFDFAISQGWIAISPVARLKLPKPPTRQSKSAELRETYEPYDIEDLRKLFNSPLYRGCLNSEHGVNRPGDRIIRRARYWVPIISLFTGMRLNEVLQLEAADVRPHEQGIWYISVNDEVVGTYEQGTYNKRLKTKNSHRDIPVHPFLLQIGFQKWVGKQPLEGRLFPDAVLGRAEKLSDNFSKKYRSFAKAAGVYVPRRKVFHSFRNTFNGELRRVGVSGEIREALNGWQPQRAMDAKYGRGFPITMLYNEIAKVTYDGLNLDHLVGHHGQLD